MRNYAGKTILVTGGAGFIGSALVRQLIAETDATVANVDKLTYAGHLESLSGCLRSPRHFFEKTDICDRESIEKIFSKYRPSAVMHLAAESHVDRSIDGPVEFINTNVIGTYTMLDVCTQYVRQLETDTRQHFVFHHISTDEVYGTLGATGLFTEQSPYRPSSPYSASKAAADHLVHAWHRTYGLPVVITNCSNNYGPYQYPEKFIPVVIRNAIGRLTIPVYGDGSNVRDWLYVEDHVRALRLVLERGRLGETYNVGGSCEVANLELAHTICELLQELKPVDGPSYDSLIKLVRDRPGHDQRYAIDINKLQTELNWRPAENLNSGLRKTVEWYLANREWCERVTQNVYHGQRLGLTDVASRT